MESIGLQKPENLLCLRPKATPCQRRSLLTRREQFGILGRRDERGGDTAHRLASNSARGGGGDDDQCPASTGGRRQPPDGERSTAGRAVSGETSNLPFLSTLGRPDSQAPFRLPAKAARPSLIPVEEALLRLRGGGRLEDRQTYKRAFQTPVSPSEGFPSCPRELRAQ